MTEHTEEDTDRIEIDDETEELLEHLSDEYGAPEERILSVLVETEFARNILEGTSMLDDSDLEEL